MSFAPGEVVRITPLKKDGTIIEALSSDRYRVQVGSLTVTCHAEDLFQKKASEKKISKKRLSGTSKLTTSKEVQALTQRKKRMLKAPALDLHGKRVHEVEPLVEAFLNDTVLAGYETVEIVHGVGTGAVQSVVHKLLESISVVARYTLKEGNSGTTIVYFR